MYTMAENVIATGSESRPPMLERRTATSPATVRERTLGDLTIEEKIHQACDIKLYAYLRKHEAHEKEVRMMMQRFPDPLALNVQGRQTKGYAGNVAKGNATRTSVIRNTGNTTTNQEKVIRCYNYKGEGYNAKQCTQPKRAQNSEWFKDKMLLAQAKEARVALDEEQRAFLGYTREGVESGIDDRALTTTAIFQTDDIDAFDSEYDKAPTSSAVFMANLTSYDLDILSGYLKGNENEVVQSTTSPEQQDAMIMSTIDEMSNHVAKCNAVNKKNKIMNESLTVELE
ncbi:hypothetical protein Tco_1289658 [Tanacetum coccineum]